MSFEVSVIVSTYNQPEWLRKVLIGYECQSFKNFEVIIADDGSTKETEDVINQFKTSKKLEIT
ncbi:MAG: glycosyltransferase, partial [Olleya sp.]